MTLRISWNTTAETETAGEISLESTEHILEFDAVTRENHNSESEVTTHTVETGEAIADHKRAMPRRIEIQAFVTNTPLDAPPQSGPRTSFATAQVQDTGEGNVTVFSEQFDRVSDVWETLLELQREAIDLTVTTTYQVYENVQLVRVSVPRDEAEDAATFEITLQEVFRATAELIDDPVPREPRARPRQEQNTAPEETDSDPDEPNNSQLWDMISGL